MAAQYIAMLLDGKTPVWQKIEPGQVQIVTTQIVTYVDENDQPVDLPEVYEMIIVQEQT